MAAWRRWRYLLGGVATLLLTATAAAGSSPPMAVEVDPPPVRPLPLAADWDYQLGGARSVRADVGVVVRDRLATTAGRYDVCYVNAFQTQPDEVRFWNHPDRRRLLLHRGGRPVVDAGWGETLLDTRTARKREKLARIVGAWLSGCASSGAEAVEFDNLDSWTRSRRLLSRADNLAYARLLVSRAHAQGLAAAQKNTPQLGTRGKDIGFDFAVAESCARWHECGDYVHVYGSRVLAVEYRRSDFARACQRWGARLSIILRDRAVTPGGPRRHC